MTNENSHETQKFTHANPGSNESESGYDDSGLDEVKDNFFFDKEGELRVIFNFIFLVIFHVVVSTSVMFLLGLLFPDYFGLFNRTLIVIGVVAIFFGFKDMRKC